MKPEDNLQTSGKELNKILLQSTTELQLRIIINNLNKDIIMSKSTKAVKTAVAATVAQNIIGQYIYKDGVVESDVTASGGNKAAFTQIEINKARVAYADPILEECRQEFIGLCEKVGDVSSVLVKFHQELGKYSTFKPSETTIYRAQALQAKPSILVMMTVILRGAVAKKKVKNNLI